MIGRRATVGLALLAALLFSASAVQSASAAAAKNTTAYTCIKVEPAGTGDFTDAHCDKKGKGDYAHQSLANDVTTNITLTNDKMGVATNEKTSQLWRFTFIGIKIEITCKVHEVTGIAEIKYNGCEVKLPAKCTVKEPIESAANIVGVEELGAGKNEMGVELTPKEGSTLLTFTFSGEGCGLKGKSINVEGTMIGTSGTGSNTVKESGATVTFTEGMTKETLKAGGNAVEHKGGFTVKMEPIGGKDQNPIALTTTT
jgi:hypothetical protein